MTRRRNLKQVAESIEPGVVVVEPWMMRRIIRLDGRVLGFGRRQSRHETYPIERNRLLALIDSRELGLTAPGSMPERLVVLAEPEDTDLSGGGEVDRLVHEIVRPLFHACVHLVLGERLAHEPAAEAVVARRREELGEPVFAEIQAVLLQDDRLFADSSDADVYVEFVASYLEMSFFAPETLRCFFPGIRDTQAVNAIIRQDIDYNAVYARVHVPEWEDARRHEEQRGEMKDSAPSESIPLAEFRQLQMQAELAAAGQDQVRAALSHASASLLGPDEYRAECHAAACAELSKLAQRLRDALHLTVDEGDEWTRCLPALLVPTSERGLSVEARLLYDLQKACVEHERRVHRTSIWRWIRSRGKRSCDRPLPLLGNALASRHLHRARRRVSTTRLEVASRKRLTELLEHALLLVDTRTRLSLRHTLSAVFEDSGLHPENMPERVARAKMIEELIDRILERGYVSMADLRDALSNNDLKLPDVTGPGNFLRGDRLLKADRACSVALEGVYRRGAVYQRWPQMLSSLAFGTRTGRFLTRFIAVPYGGAYLAVEFLRHFGHFLGSHESSEAAVEQASTALHAPVSTQWLFYATVLCLGTWISLLVHRPSFRQWNVRLLQTVGCYARLWFVDIPLRVIRSKFVQRVFTSLPYRVLQDYLLRPVFLTAIAVLLTRTFGIQASWRFWLELTLVVALFLNSPLGRFVGEVATQYLIRVWHDLRIHVIGSFVQWIMEVFRGLLNALERVINYIDDLLRMRAGGGRMIRAFKILGGACWYVVAYVLIFVFTLLVEPQINPIKHFPVVTVSHKLILPTGPAIVKQLSSVLGGPLANTLVWTTIWLVPGMFGFLVWELKENWRLYRANRPRYIGSKCLGSHGETMLRFLRPAFHSGTLPKAFSSLRRFVQRGESPNAKRCQRRWAAIRRVELDVQRFVERELLTLLKEERFLGGAQLNILSTHASTNRIVIVTNCELWPDRLTEFSWEYVAGQLVGRISARGWVDCLEEVDRATLGVAVSGLLQRTGVDDASGPVPLTITPPVTWLQWVDLWNMPPEVERTGIRCGHTAG